MPELPEVETVRRGLAPVLVDATILSVDQRRPDLRFPFPERFAARLAGRRITALERRAKYLWAHLDDGIVLVMHLGMSGSFRIEAACAVERPGLFHHPRGVPGLHDHVELTLSNGMRIVYNDPRRFGFMLLVAAAALDTHPLFVGIGVEPLGDELDGALLARLFAGRATTLKAALLDQKLIAGLGNIYVCEALHRAGLSPRRAAGTLARRNGTPTARAVKLAAAVREVLVAAVEAGGSTLRDHRQADGTMGYFQHSFRVYDREDDPCPKITCPAWSSASCRAGARLSSARPVRGEAARRSVLARIETAPHLFLATEEIDHGRRQARAEAEHRTRADGSRA